MAQIFGREPATSTTQERPKPRVTPAGDGGKPARVAPPAGDGGNTGRLARLLSNINDIRAELNKVTWPTRDETRNLTIVVIGISVGLGLFLGGIDLLLSTLYSVINP